jgi:hypothetical protein
VSRWPPILWLCIAVGSLLLLIGYNGADTDPQALIPGILLILAGAGGSVWRPWSPAARTRSPRWWPA